MDLFACQADIRNSDIVLWNITSVAMPTHFAAFLRSVVFIGQAAFGGSFDFPRIVLRIRAEVFRNRRSKAREDARKPPVRVWASYQIRARTYFAARPAIQERPPTAAKNTTAIQASESGSLFVTMAAKIVSAANPDVIAIVRPHR